MKRKILIILLFAIVIGCVTGVAACGGGGEMDCKTVIISSDDYYANRDSILANSSKVVSNAVSSADNESLVIGEEYFFVLAARGHAGNHYSLHAAITIECSDIELTNFTRDNYVPGYYNIHDGYEEYSLDGYVIVTAVADDGHIEITINSYTSYENTLSFYLAVGFKINSECEFFATYEVTARSSDTEAGSGELEKSVWVYYENQVKVNTLSVMYLSQADYNGGNFSDSSLASTVSLPPGSYAYMVIDFEMEGVFDNADNQKITIEAAISPSKYCKGRIQDANTSTVTDETISDGVSIANASYTIPENGKTRSERLIIRIEASVAGEVYVSVYFYNNEANISASGNSRYSGSFTIEGNTEGITFALNSDGESYTVTDISTTATGIDVPYYYNGYPVTAIADDAFEGCSDLTYLYIPDSVESLSQGLLSDCTSLVTLTVPFVGGTVDISEYVYFYYIFGNSNSDIPSTLKNVTVTGGNYFSGRLGILYCAFERCSSIESITLVGDVTLIGQRAFFGCTSLKSIELPDGLTGIAWYAFYGCSSLESIEIPDSVTEISSEAFSGCTALTSITLGSGLTSIGEKAFYNCTALTEINFNATAMEDLTSANYVFYCAGQSGDGITVTIGADVTKIPAYLFFPYEHSVYDYSPKITSVVFKGSKCESMGSYAFYNCSSLTSVYITDLDAWLNMTFGNAYASPMYYAKYLYLNKTVITGSIVLSDDVTAIPCGTFKNSTITSITIPDSVTSIGTYAFGNCSSLASVYYGGTASQWASISFSNAGANPLRYTENLYIDGTVLTDLKDTDITDISAYAFTGWNVTSITLPSSVTSIGNNAFYNCTSLASVTIGDNVETIGNYAFSSCTALTSITIPSSVTTVGSYAFSGCTSLKSVTIGSGVTSIGIYAFDGCTAFATVTVRSSGGTSAWYVTKTSGASSGTSVSISAENLKSTYASYYWYRK